MARLGVALGGETLKFGGLAGIGDIVAACSSGHGRNHEVGRRLAAGEPLEAVLASAEGVAEGVPAVRAVRLYAEAMGLELPIVTALHAMLYEGVPVSEALGRLLATPVGPEFPALSGR
jgi:glycerol-3-phosphate dehydrogenase (NAD(P)+)